MIERLIHFSLQQRFLILAGTLFIAAFGVWSLSTLPIDAFPDLTNNQVNVVTEARGLAAAEVEQLVTFPIESAMMGIRGTEEVRSISKYGLSIVTIVFVDGMDTYFVRQLVNERLQEARDRIPPGLEPTMGPVATAFGEIYQYVVEGGGLSATELKTLHDWNIKFQLRTVPGVNEVNSWGGFVRQFHVIVNPDRLLAHNLTLNDVVSSLSSSNQNFGGALLEKGAEAFTVRGLGRLDSEDDIRKVVVRSTAGVPVLIGDVASVEIGHAVRQGAVTRDGKGEVVAGMVIMTKGENSKSVIERVKDRIQEIGRTLPDGVRLVPFYDQTALVDRTTNTVARNLIEGGALVIVVLFLFLKNIPAALIVASVIPLSMLIAFIGMKAFGVSANLMSLGAIDFGLIVDASVVMMENFIRRLQPHHHGVIREDRAATLPEIIRKGAFEVARPIVFGVSIIIAVYLPIFALEGMSARMFHPMAVAVVVAILGSLVLAMTYVPVMASLLLRKRDTVHRELVFDALRKAYRRWLARAIRYRPVTLAFAGVLIVAALAVGPYLGTEFMPELDEGALLIETRRLPSISITESVEMAGMVERVVREFPEVETVVTKMGRPDLATEAMGMYQGDVYVILKPREEWSYQSKEDLIEALDAKLREIPGVAYNFTQPLAMRLDEVISGVRSDVAVKLFGDDFAQLESSAEAVRRVLQNIRGAADVQIETLGGARELHIQINRPEMARFGLRVEDVADVVETSFGGRAATQVLEGRRRFDVVVRLPEDRREDEAAIRNLQIQAPGGERVALGRIATVGQAEGPEVVNREDAQRRIVIQSNVRGRDIGTFVAEAQRRIASDVKLPPGYYVTYGGEFENQQRAMARLYLIGPVVILLIFLLLFSAFSSLRQAGLIMVNLPLAFVGGVAALALRGLHLSLSASIGFIALFGVAVLNGLVMVGQINVLLREGYSLKRAVLQGASQRLRPVLMTALVASLGFLPMAMSTAPGAEVQRPLATVVIGGLITSTLLTLFVLPSLFEWVERTMGRRRKPDLV